jgi:uncharacterized protein (DUF1810 family)
MRAQNDLERFVEAQDRVYEDVRQELAAGRKATHWMWFVFPQLRGLGRSATAWTAPRRMRSSVPRTTSSSARR